MNYYVHIIRTDSDIDTGYGPFNAPGIADRYALRTQQTFADCGWFDDCYTNGTEPADGCKEPVYVAGGAQ